MAAVSPSRFLSRDDPVRPAAVVGGVGWASFDDRVILADLAAASSSSSSMAAVSTTSNGLEVRVSLRLAAPPAASYVELYTDACLHMVVAVRDDDPFDPPTDNFFVYKADPDWPWLRRLPSIGDWMGRPWHTGVARLGGAGNWKGFVVADLQPRTVYPHAGGMDEEAELFRYSSAAGRWELKRLDMPHDPEKGLHPLCWETDAVFSLGGSTMCWADYHRGVVLCDVAAADPVLRFVRFPGIEIWDDFIDGRGLPAMYRTASVRGGRLWFVDVDNGRFRQQARTTFSRRTGAVITSRRTVITTWTLCTPELEWRKELTLQHGELLSQRRYRRSPLPRSLPGFPMIDMLQHDVIHFVVRRSWEDPENWMITVDMRNKCLKSYQLYQNAIEAPESDEDVKNMFWDEPLICCELYKNT
ncbi:hypothetical protein ACP70R_004326 [Stipagrostis hirtigluma subsp. patula]